jgi:predicted nuclease with RNAse H fold
MLFLGYDPGGKGTHGVAAIHVSSQGIVTENPICEVVRDAEAAWSWLSSHPTASALGIDTLLAWSPSGGRSCDDALRRAYRQFGASVIPQNALYSSMTLNGAIVARRAARADLPLFESHPKLLVKTRSLPDAATSSMLNAYSARQQCASSEAKSVKAADDMADAIVAAWCAAQGFSRRWTINLFDIPGDDLEPVAPGVTYPWPEPV